MFMSLTGYEMATIKMTIFVLIQNSVIYSQTYL